VGKHLIKEARGPVLPRKKKVYHTLSITENNFYLEPLTCKQCQLFIVTIKYHLEDFIAAPQEYAIL
jgi:hypothetical protein